MSVKYDLISSGSSGNAIVYEDVILVDAGVSYKYLVGHLNDVKILLLTHRHSDHFKTATIKHLVKDYPNLVIMCGEWLKHLLDGLETANVMVCEFGKWYRVGDVQVSMVMAYHDVKNCGWRIFVNNKKIFHLTDTYTVDGISAKDYDCIAIESHHDEMQIEKDIEDKINQGVFCYEIGARNSHLSFQKAQKFINENRKEDTIVLKLHISGKYLDDEKYKHLVDKNV